MSLALAANEDMDEDDADLLAAVESAENPSVSVSADLARPKGFVTATGKAVTVSESSLAMARRLWTSMSEDELQAPEVHLKQMTELKRIALAKSSMAKASQMWQEAAEKEMSVTEAHMKRMLESKRIALSSNSMVKATQMWVDAAKEMEDNKGNAGGEQPPAISPRSVDTISRSGPMKLAPLSGGAWTPSGPTVAAFKPLTPGFTLSDRRKRPALGVGSPATQNGGASPSLLAVGSAKRPRLKFKAPTRVVTTAATSSPSGSSSQKENEAHSPDLETKQFESDICDFMDKMEESELSTEK